MHNNFLAHPIWDLARQKYDAKDALVGREVLERVERVGAKPAAGAAAAAPPTAAKANPKRPRAAKPKA